MTGYINSSTTFEELTNQIEMDPNATEREKFLIELCRHPSESLNDEISSLEEEISDLESDMRELRAELQDAEKERDEFEKKNDELRAQHAALAAGAQQA